MPLPSTSEGTASRRSNKPIIKAKNDGTRSFFNELKSSRNHGKNFVVLNKNGTVSISCERTALVLGKLQHVIGSIIAIGRRRHLEEGRNLYSMDPYNVPIITEKARKDRIPRTLFPVCNHSKEVDEATGVMRYRALIEHRKIFIRRSAG